MDAFWAKDVLELFHLERRASFQRFAELVLAGSGGMRSFRRRYAGPINIVVAGDVVRPFERRYGALRVSFLGLEHMAGLLSRRIARQ